MVPVKRLPAREAKRALELADAATPGEWEPHVERWHNPYGPDEEGGSGPRFEAKYVGGKPVTSVQAFADADFIAESRTLVPELAEEVLRLRKELSATLVELRELRADKFRLQLEQLQLLNEKYALRIKDKSDEQ